MIDLAHLLVRHGRGCFLFKLDLERAYRQLPTDPWDWPLLGIAWEGMAYFDKSIPFGVRHGAMACQRVTEAVSYVAKKEADTDSEGYIDDTLAVCPPDLSVATRQYENFHSVVEFLGLTAALSKCVGPCTRLSWIGVTFDSVQFTMQIDPDKIVETLDFIKLVLELPSITKRQLQSLLGKLNHSSKLAPHAKIFLNRGFFMLRAMHDTRPLALDPEFREDLGWFLAFLARYNGRAIVRSFSEPTVTLEVDACLVGGGGVSASIGYFYYMFPPHILALDLHISALECWNVLVSLRLWQTQLSGVTVKINCDNSATVTAISSGKCSCPHMAAVLKEIWVVCSSNDIHITPHHKAGVLMTDPDLLSRAFVSHTNWQRLCKFRDNTKLMWFPVPPDCLLYPTCNWEHLMVTTLLLLVKGPAVRLNSPNPCVQADYSFIGLTHLYPSPDGKVHICYFSPGWCRLSQHSHKLVPLSLRTWH